ncbi:MAG: tetratricopeptide repeat protein [Termitinemataceae bacterium]|nr:MAG: tetratricopeptide repeat protein [Termitinemataceae bacterium]
MRYEAHIRSLNAIILFTALCAGVWAQQGRDALELYRAGSYDAAAEVCKREIAERADNLEAHVVLCWSLLKLSRYSDAAVYAAEAARLSRYDVRVIEILGEIEYFQGRNKTAMQYFQEYVNLAAEGQRIDMVYYFMGEIYIRLGQFRHADIAISTALHYVGVNALWWSRLAYTREMLGDNMEAIRAYSRALELNPNLSDARRGLERVRAAIDR